MEPTAATRMTFLAVYLIFALVAMLVSHPNNLTLRMFSRRNRRQEFFDITHSRK